MFFDIRLEGGQSFTASGSLTFNDTIDIDANSLIMNSAGSVVVNGTLTNSFNYVNQPISLIKTNIGTLTISSSAAISSISAELFYVELAEGTLVVDGDGGNALFYSGW